MTVPGLRTPLVLLVLLIAACTEASPTPRGAPDPPASPAGPASPGAPVAQTPPSQGETAMPAQPAKSDKVVRSEEEWRKILTPEQYRVMREKGTERAFTGRYWDTQTPGVYKCAACGEPLFSSDAKFDSGCGWPSFFQPLPGVKLVESRDNSLGMVRTEITCAKCGAHMGHVFDDGPAPTGLRYCINSVSIDLEPAKGETKPAK
jgi:peptide-methionine (R)-S-oxide reductase